MNATRATFTPTSMSEQSHEQITQVDASTEDIQPSATEDDVQMIEGSVPQAAEEEGTTQTGPEEATIPSKASKAPLLREIPPGKSALPFSRVQRILKADRVSPACPIN